MIICVKDHPIVLWNFMYGTRLTSYTAYNDKDEMVTPMTVTFDRSGERIYSGYLGCLRIFRLSRPGRDFEERKLTPSKKSKEGQKGLVTTIAFSPDRIYAVGSYSGLLGIYEENSDEPVTLFNSQHEQGISQVEFTSDGVYLISSGRKDNWVTVWDLRVTGRELYHFERPMNSYQRTRFSLQGSLLALGDQVNTSYEVETLIDPILTCNERIEGIM